jgi:predicted transcriptional regulator
MSGGKRTQVVTFSLPRDLFRELEELRHRRFQKRSEIVKEAIRQYIETFRESSPDARYWALRQAAVPYDDEPYTAADRAAVARAKAEIRRGEFVTLDQLNRKLRDVARRRSKKRR